MPQLVHRADDDQYDAGTCGLEQTLGTQDAHTKSSILALITKFIDELAWRNEAKYITCEDQKCFHDRE